jgi:hypothetical protein
MNYILLLLAAMVGSAYGVELGWNVMGVTTIGEKCTEEAQEFFYEECVRDVAVTMGVDLDRRLELRGNRGLQQSDRCYSCCQNCISAGHECGCYPKGVRTYC